MPGLSITWATSSPRFPWQFETEVYTCRAFPIKRQRGQEVRGATSDRAESGGASRLACLDPRSEKLGEATDSDGWSHAPRHGQGCADASNAFLPLGPHST